jgi:hypothetical protein
MLAVSAMLIPQTASAVPSFARQTGMACATCHTAFPELTPFGRSFKLGGYTLTLTPTVEDKAQSQTDKLSLSTTPPLSVMVQTSLTSVKRPEADTQNSTVLFPQQLSLFYAGRITPMIGSFIQFTYDGNEDKISMDNADIRSGKTTVLGGNEFHYGLTLNNSPTVQDLWNSTPVWGYPYAGSSVAPGPTAAVLLDGGLAQTSAGLGAYGAYHLGSDLLYGELTLYRSAHLGNGGVLSSSSAADVIQNSAPYLRLAYEHNWGDNSWEVGLLGLNADTYPAGTIPGDITPTDSRKDTGVDTQYQHIAGDHVYTVHAIHIQEKQEWGSTTASNPSDKLSVSRVTGSYYFKRTYGAILQYFDTHGDADALLYSGSANGSPKSAGGIVEVLYMPWENTRFSLQYTYYSKFDGAGTNYDGAGRNASDNNTTYLVGWFMW